MKLLKILKRQLSCKYYDFETLPMWNFNRIMKTNNLKYLIRVKMFTNYGIQEAWQELLDKDVEFNGLNENVKQIIKHKKQLALKMCKYLEKHEPLLLNEINILENQIKALEKTNRVDEQLNFSIVCGFLSKHFGFKIDERRTTLKEYRAYLKVIEEEQKQIEKYNLKK